jgi:hypothetical protein
VLQYAVEGEPNVFEPISLKLFWDSLHKFLRMKFQQVVVEVIKIVES